MDSPPSTPPRTSRPVVVPDAPRKLPATLAAADADAAAASEAATNFFKSLRPEDIGVQFGRPLSEEEFREMRAKKPGGVRVLSKKNVTP